MTPLQRLLTKSHDLNKARTPTREAIMKHSFSHVPNISCSLCDKWDSDNKEFREHAANVHETLLKIIGVQNECLNRVQSTAGHPDAAEGCRLIIKQARQALSIVDELASKVEV